MPKFDTFGWAELFSLAAVTISFVTVCASMFARSKNSTQNEQRMFDKLDTLSGITKETNDDVKEISRKIDDHSERLAHLEAEMGNAFNRIKRIETTQDNCQACRLSKEQLSQHSHAS